MRVLVVTFFHPPAPGGGGTRWEAMARHLGAMGHDVTFLTTGAFGSIDGEEGVVRTRDLTSSRALRALLRRPAAAAEAGTKPAPGLLTRVVVPDAHRVSWLPWASRAARRLARDADVVVTTSPPESTHLLGLKLGRPWVADLRDGWRFEPLRPPFPTAAQRAYDARLERLVATRADAVTAATRPIADDLRRRLGVDAEWVTNGYDAGSGNPIAQASGAVQGAGSDRVFSRLVHTGGLSGPWGRDPAALFAALRRVDGVRLVLAGALSEVDRALVAAAGDRVEHVGVVSRDEALALQRDAAALLLVTSENSGEASGKLFEYLFAGRPILALAAGNEAARIVGETGTGVAVAPHDEDAIVRELRRLVDGSLPYAPRGLEPYAYPAPAERMAAILERVTR